jgi:hypothetical protein
MIFATNINNSNKAISAKKEYLCKLKLITWAITKGVDWF